MKKLHLASSCLTLVFLLACGDRESDQPENDGAGDEASAETRPEQPADVEGPATPNMGVTDKLTCPTGCVKISATPPSPSCCNCNGQDRMWKRSAWSATTWLCQ